MADDQLLNGLPELTLDQVIDKLQRIRKKLKRNMPVRYADGYDNALAVFCVNLEKDTGWDGEPEETYVCLS
jgi:hypothetical protein